jgi:hypothetical protein
MKLSNFVLAGWLAVMTVGFVFTTNCPAQEESGADLIKTESEPRFTFHNYANLAELVAVICDDAGQQFDDFFGPSRISVQPFGVIGDYRIEKITILGMTMADQMAAMINTNSVARQPADIAYDQSLGGMLEELDGYLRIHIHGRNVYGERRAYVANVEMSEPVYRALHSYVESF